VSGATHVRYELLRCFRNRLTYATTLALPLVLYYTVAGSNRHAHASGISFPLYFMTGMAAYGAMFAAVAPARPGVSTCRRARRVAYGLQAALPHLATVESPSVVTDGGHRCSPSSGCDQVAKEEPML
jgi:ABC-2 type transport system permease protein